jgi:hypothetical protein
MPQVSQPGEGFSLPVSFSLIDHVVASVLALQNAASRPTAKLRANDGEIDGKDTCRLLPITLNTRA